MEREKQTKLEVKLILKQIGKSFSCKNVTDLPQSPWSECDQDTAPLAYSSK
jgi:hypothetical protein